MDLQKVQTIAIDAAREAGKIVRAYRSSGQLEVQYKSDINLVTAADIAAEKEILHRLLHAFPEIPVLAEESSPDYAGEALKKGGLWVIDPIDGTTNYAKGHPHVGISIAFLLHGVAKVGVVYAPFADELFCAIKGGGATLNGMPIHCNAPQTLRQTLVATGFPYERSIEHVQFLMSRASYVVRYCQDLRRLGAASLDSCWVACGRLEAYYESVSPWDIAAGSLIAREAGAVVTSLSASPLGDRYPSDINGHDMLVCCPSIYEQMKAVLLGEE